MSKDRTNNRAWTFGNDIDTDVIIAARYLSVEREELKKYVFCDYRPEFPRDVKEGDVIVAGRNFGCGSSREHAPLAIKEAGVKYVLAKSFARIFYRNAVNLGIYAVECSDKLDDVEEGDELEVNIREGKVYNKTKDFEIEATSYPPFMLEIVEAGGLVPYTRERILKNE
ncbi:3-isopropylmalate dehydratase small subunit [Natranaerofaba carboxydovora]|uniref:3-isopropylmalate dehydratase small subunit n=1 Tax=Natranaerofaba carboxydovora TaxID=2742683 RepID=UPI001F12A0D1|nr:3-isopropylmalate dehydratase small subunit [Natranaerofaba carboxydovora]UMZ75210.1 2,3-dimethylmalate dehydratase small subunit [Natranaerofaba carboxydovora]